MGALKILNMLKFLYNFYGDPGYRATSMADAQGAAGHTPVATEKNRIATFK